MANRRLSRIKRLVDVRERDLQKSIGEFQVHSRRLREAEANLQRVEEIVFNAKVEFRKLAVQGTGAHEWRTAQEWYVSQQAHSERCRSDVVLLTRAFQAAQEHVSQARIGLKQVETLSDRARAELLQAEDKEQTKSDAEHAMRIALAAG